MKNSVENKNRILNFTNRILIGFVIALFVVFTAFEYTVVKTTPIIKGEEILFLDDDFLPPITIRKVEEVKKPEPPKQKDPDITIVKDIEKPKPTDKPIEPIEQIETPIVVNKDYFGMKDEIIDEVEPPRSSVEVFPHTENCAGLNGEALKACSLQDIVNHIKREIEIPEILKEISGRHGANMTFVINNEGKVEQIKVDRQTHKSMGEAAKKAIEKLPQMIPPSQHGQAVSLIVTVPVVVSIQ